MSRWPVISLSIFLLAGCAHGVSRKGLISEQLPLTVDDLSEIRAGEQNHERVLWEYRLYESPKLEQYCTAIAKTIGDVTTRPNLPYHVVLLDDAEINIFGGPGGYIYITRGVFDFVESESELAAAIAHEIVHVANFDYSNIPQVSKMQKAYGYMLQGSELAKSSIGTYGTAANYGLKGIGKAAPAIGRRFGHDQEIVTDKRALEALVAAGYDPHGYLKFVDKLSRVPMEDIGRFANLMNAHPPFADRRELLGNKISKMHWDRGDIAFKKDTLSEVRQTSVNQAAAASDSILFNPASMRETPVIDQPTQDKEDKYAAYRKRWAWF